MNLTESLKYINELENYLRHLDTMKDLERVIEKLRVNNFNGSIEKVNDVGSHDSFGIFSGTQLKINIDTSYAFYEILAREGTLKVWNIPSIVLQDQIRNPFDGYTYYFCSSIKRALIYEGAYCLFKMNRTTHHKGISQPVIDDFIYYQPTISNTHTCLNEDCSEKGDPKTLLIFKQVFDKMLSKIEAN